MEMKELDYFIAIAEEKSISKAAERLFMAQSSLSQFLSILENNVGSKLFIRTSRGVRLTQEGELMLQYAYKTLAEYRSVQNEIKDMKQLKQLDNTEKCPCCNALVRKGDAFCSKCGAALHQEEETAEKDNADVVTEDDFVPEEAAEEPVKDQKEDLVEESGEMTENTTEEETKQEEEPVSEPEE